MKKNVTVSGKYIIAVLLIVGIGVIASMFLVPSEEELALIEEKTEIYAESGDARGVVDFEKRYLDGDRSFYIVSGYADLLEQQGKKAEAGMVIQQYVTNNPNDLDGLKRLALFYRDNGQKDEYAQLVMRVVELEPSEDNLKLLADLHNYKGEFDKQIEILQRLVEMTQKQKPQYMADLGIVLLQQERKEEAVATLKELRELHPNFINYGLTRAFVSIDMEEGNHDDAFARARDWLSDPANAQAKAALQMPSVDVPETAAQPVRSDATYNQQLADLAAILLYGGRADLSLELIQPYRQRVTANLDLLDVYINAHIAEGRNDDAYDILARIYRESELPKRFYPTFLSLALSRGEEELALELAQDLTAEEFNELQAINLVELAYGYGNTEVEDTIVGIFDDAIYLEDKVVLSAIIAMATNRSDENDVIRVAMDAEQYDGYIYELRLAQSCVRNRKKFCYDELMERLPALSALTSQEILEIANLYIAANKPSAIYDPVAMEEERRNDAAVTYAKIKLAAAANKKQDFDLWLADNAATVSMSRLEELFFLANDRRNSGIASLVAEVMYDRDNNADTREYLISAYMRSGQYGKALPFLRQDRGLSKAHEDNYISTLTRLAKNNGTYRKELGDVVAAKLKRGNLSEKRQLELVYTLINSGNKQMAMPYIKQYAQTRGGSWQDLYLETLDAKGDTATSSQYRMDIAMNPETPKDIRRRMAYRFMDDGNRDAAIAIFSQLAADAGPDSKDVNELLFLWGPKLSNEQLAWLQSRADASQGQERAKWAEHIVALGDEMTLVQWVPTAPTSLQIPDVRKRYFAAIAKQNSEQAFDTNFVNWVNQNDHLPSLRDYVSTAIAYSYKDAAIRGLNRITLLSPNDEKALLDLATQHYYRAQYSTAEGYLNRYMQVNAGASRPVTNPYIAHFMKAELARREGNRDAAMGHYQQVVALTDANYQLSKEAELKRLSALFHLGQRDTARQGYQTMLMRNPNDKGVLADYIAMLVEYKLYDEAKAVANQYGMGRQQLGAVEFGEPTLAAVKEYYATSDEVIVLRRANDEYVDLVQVPTQVNDPRAAELKRQEDLRLQLLYARIELESGNEQAALDRLEAIKPYFPDDAQLLGFTANAENFAGNSFRALTLLDQAQQITPENEDIESLRNAIRRQYSQHVKLDYDWRRIGDSDENIFTLSGVAFIGRQTEVGTVLQHDQVFGSAQRRASDGAIVDTEVERQRGEVYLAYNADGGERIQLSAFANNDEPGAGLYYTFRNMLGRTTLLGEYRRPYWDFTQAVIESASRDRVGFQHLTKISPDLTFLGEASLNNYHIKEFDDVSTSLILRGNAIYELQDVGPYLALAYGFDGEYMDKKTKLPFGSAGDNYAPFQLGAREIHALNLIVAEDLTPTTRGEFIGGYAYDRLGGNGPIAELRLTEQVTDAVEAQLRARYGVEANETDNNLTQVGGHLKYNF